MSLTDAKIRAAKAKEKAYKLFDGDGLYLEVSPAGGKWWRLKYRINGKEKRLSLGTYPEVPLASSKNHVSGTTITGAREKCEAARQLLGEGIDPSEHRRAERSAKEELTTNSFEAVTREWLVKFSSRLKPESVARKLKIFENDIFPWIGPKPIAALTAQEVLSVLRRIEDRGAGEIAARAKMYCGQAFRYAVATGRAGRDPTQDLKEALAPRATTHHAALTDPAAVGGLLRAIDGYEGYFVTRCALRLAPLVFVRPGELRNAEWKEFNLEQAEWLIPAERMKMGQTHLVPLSTRAVAILRELHPRTKFSRYVFPSARTGTRPMSEVAILAALRRMGFTKDEMSAHGFRAMARTLLDEVLGFRPDYIEHQLAHAVRDPNGRAYNRTTHLPQRREMMQKWADYLDGLRVEGAPHPMVVA